MRSSPLSRSRASGLSGRSEGRALPYLFAPGTRDGDLTVPRRPGRKRPARRLSNREIRESGERSLAFVSRATRELRDSVAVERSTVAYGGDVVYLRRLRRDGTEYSLRVRVGATRSTLPAAATLADGRGGTLRIGVGETFADARDESDRPNPDGAPCSEVA